EYRRFLLNIRVTWIVQIANYATGLWFTPFVPVFNVIKAFDLITDDFDDEPDDFLDYFEKTWIGEPNKSGTGRKKTLFPIEIWNVYDRAVANFPR
ncbi:unnamed protein product, partial [Rotaria magnacalcarata]